MNRFSISLRLGPPSAHTYLQHLAQGRSKHVSFDPPARDGDFDSAINSFATYMGANLAALGLVAGDIVAFTAMLTDWNAKFPAHITAQESAESARAAKDLSRNTIIPEASRLSTRMEGSGLMTDAKRAALHMTVPDTVLTHSPVPTTRPIGTVDARVRLRHVIAFRDEMVPTDRKPDGVRGVEIWVKIGGTPPTSYHDCEFIALDTRTPYTLDFTGPDGGQTAYYMLRWQNTRGESGPWSETVAATIGA